MEQKWYILWLIYMLLSSVVLTIFYFMVIENNDKKKIRNLFVKGYIIGAHVFAVVFYLIVEYFNSL